MVGHSTFLVQLVDHSIPLVLPCMLKVSIMPPALPNTARALVHRYQQRMFNRAHIHHINHLFLNLTSPKLGWVHNSSMVMGIRRSFPTKTLTLLLSQVNNQANICNSRSSSSLHMVIHLSRQFMDNTSKVMVNGLGSNSFLTISQHLWAMHKLIKVSQMPVLVSRLYLV